jgi:hypothetical protein
MDGWSGILTGEQRRRSRRLLPSIPGPMCNDLQSSAARPAIIGRNLSTFGETIGGVKPELNETQPALRETDPHSSAWDRNP